MIPRRVKEHFNNRKWPAVMLDFAIVVTGVFIGLQFENWNNARQTEAAFEDAQERLLAESRANLETVDTFLANVEARLDAATAAIETLRACRTEESARQVIALGANTIRGTATLRLRQTALSAITGNDDFLSLLGSAEREQVQEFERRLSQSQKTLDWLESWPFSDSIEGHLQLGYTDLANIQGVEDIRMRNLTIEAPLDELCKDKAFLKSFYLYERTATIQTIRGRQIKAWLSENITEMEKEH